MGAFRSGWHPFQNTTPKGPGLRAVACTCNLWWGQDHVAEVWGSCAEAAKTKCSMGVPRRSLNPVEELSVRPTGRPAGKSARSAASADRWDLSITEFCVQHMHHSVTLHANWSNGIGTSPENPSNKVAALQHMSCWRLYVAHTH